MLNKIETLVKELYQTRNKLSQLPENINRRWSFTLDGNLIGDIGEIVTCHHFGLEPLSRGETTHDAITKDGEKVQIKTTQRNIVGLGLEKRKFEYLIVVKIEKDGKYRFIYNGPGSNVWENTKSKSISVKKLESMNREINDENRIKLKETETKH